MDGILCINKPQEYTSFDVVARLRGMTKTKRVGHSGTLDPMATGVLPIFIGNATRACDLLPNDEKSYTAEFRLGQTTDTLDVWGTVRSSVESHVSRKDLEALLPRFRGEIEQIPPMYSAVRVNGQRLYDIARQGGEVERAAKTVFISKLHLLTFDEQTQTGTLEIECSKGTYIRTIISDLGACLGTGGIMTGLIRTKACGFTLADCVTLEEAQELTAQEQLAPRLQPVDHLFYGLPKMNLNEIQTIKFRNGVKLDLNRVFYKDLDGLHRVYGANKTFLGLASLDRTDMGLKIEKMFIR